MDGGLLILSNFEATTSGYEGYTERDEPVLKGVLWAYYGELGIIVLNTHMAVDKPPGEKDHRYAQSTQMLKLMKCLHERWPKAEFYAGGDFNRMLDWPSRLPDFGLPKMERVGAKEGDTDYGDRRLPGRGMNRPCPPCLTNEDGVLDGIFAPAGKRFVLEVSSDATLVHLPGGRGCTKWGQLDALTDHKHIWAVDPAFACDGMADDPDWGPKELHWIFQIACLFALAFVVVICVST